MLEFLIKLFYLIYRVSSPNLLEKRLFGNYI